MKPNDSPIHRTGTATPGVATPGGAPLTASGSIGSRMGFDDYRARISIAELALHVGYEIRSSPRESRLVLKHPTYGDKVLLTAGNDPARQLYQNLHDSADKGTLISFVSHRMNTVFSAFHDPARKHYANVNAVLADYLGVEATCREAYRRTVREKAPVRPKADRDFSLERFPLEPLSPSNYLTEMRGIAPSVLGRPEFRECVFDQPAWFKNKRLLDPRTDDLTAPGVNRSVSVGFPYRRAEDDAVVGIELRGPRVKYFSPDSDRVTGIWVSALPPCLHRVVLVESGIDALSHLQLRFGRQGAAHVPFDTLYVSSGGTLLPQQLATLRALIEPLPKAHDFRLVLANDSDGAGARYNLLVIMDVARLNQQHFGEVATTPGRLTVHFPRDFSEAKLGLLAEGLKRYNGIVREQLGGTTDPDVAAELKRSLFTYQKDGAGGTLLSMPYGARALHFFNEALTTALGLGERLELAVPRAKDFNEALQQALKTIEARPYEVVTAGSGERQAFKSAEDALKVLSKTGVTGTIDRLQPDDRTRVAERWDERAPQTTEAFQLAVSRERAERADTVAFKQRRALFPRL